MFLRRWMELTASAQWLAEASGNELPSMSRISGVRAVPVRRRAVAAAARGGVL